MNDIIVKKEVNIWVNVHLICVIFILIVINAFIGKWKIKIHNLIEKKMKSFSVSSVFHKDII